MIYLPWLVFFSAICWMIWRGRRAKELYLRRKAVEQMKRTVASAAAVHAEPQQVSGQGRESGVTGAFAGGNQGQRKWN